MSYLIGYRKGERELVVEVVEDGPLDPRRYDYSLAVPDRSTKEERLKYEEELKKWGDEIDGRAAKLGLMNWEVIEEGEYFWASWDDGGEISYETYSWEDEGHLAVYEDAERERDCAWVWIEGELKDVSLPRWSGRDGCGSKEEAMKYLGGVCSCLYMGEELGREAEEFAGKWGIPFSWELHRESMRLLESRNARWNSSRC